MFRKAFLATFVIFLSSFIFSQTSSLVQAFEYKDVPKGSDGYDEIHYLYERGIQTGYEDGTFRGNESLSRAQAAVVITNALGLGGTSVSGQTFPDVSTTFWAYRPIERAAANGIFGGRNGRFHPSEQISKAQAAAVVSRAFNLNGTTSSSFTDISNTFWAVRQITALEQNGITDLAERFRPNSSITRAEFAKYIARSLEPSLRVKEQTSETVLYQGKVVNTRSTLNVRNQAGMHGSVIDRLSLGTVVDVYGQEGNWLRIKHGTGYGYVSKNYIQNVSSSSNTTPPPSSGDVIEEGRVTASVLNVRKGPSTSTETIGQLRAGNVIDIYGYEGNWVLIKYNGQWAYTHSGYLTTRSAGQHPLEGRVIVVDPGHGGRDPGAVANGLREKDVVLAVGLELNKKLKDHGAKVVMTRSNDTFIELNERARIANNANADIFISIHANAAVSTAHGTETFYNRRNASAESRKLAEKINDRLVEALGTRDRGVKEGNFAVIRETKMPSVLVELGFLTNSSEAAKMKQADFAEKSADAILKGIEDYYSW